LSEENGELADYQLCGRLHISAAATGMRIYAVHFVPLT
jgi:hypothetical protein